MTLGLRVHLCSAHTRHTWCRFNMSHRLLLNTSYEFCFHVFYSKMYCWLTVKHMQITSKYVWKPRDRTGRGHIFYLKTDHSI